MTDPSTLSYDAIREYAERIGTRHDIYGDDGCADLDKLLVVLGGTTRVLDSSESMHVAGHGSFAINLSTVTSQRRDRFTIAHELGHYFLHYLHKGSEGVESFNRGGRSLSETQANVFASSLLMPASAFAAAYRELDGDVWALARRFDVSPAAAEVRAKVLDLVS